MTELALPADCSKLIGKQVSDTTSQGTIVRLGEQDAVLELGDEIKAFDNLKLRLYPEGAEPIEDVYVKVQQVEQNGDSYRCEIRFTSVPAKQRDRLQALRG